jgi:hypothetical protein
VVTDAVGGTAIEKLIAQGPSDMDGLRKNRNEENATWNQSRLKTERQRMCGMSGVAGRLVVSSPSVCGVWAHRML